MQRARVWGAMAVLGMLAASCAGPTVLVDTWLDPAYKRHPVHKVMVVGLGENPARINSFESIMGSRFESRKLAVVRGSTLRMNDTGDLEVFKQNVRDSGADLVSITRLIGISNESQYTPASSYYVPTAGYYGMGSYYHSSFVVAQDPGYVTEYKVYKVETNVYDVQTEKLVWSGVSHTTDPADFQEGASSLAVTVVDELVRNKVIP